MTYHDPGDELVPGVDYDDRYWYEDEVGSGIDRIMVERARDWERRGLDDYGDEPAAWERDTEPAEPEATPDTEPPPPHRCGECIEPAPYDDFTRTYLCCCARCRTAPSLPLGYALCAACMTHMLCKVCGRRTKVAKDRCDTCRKYFERTGQERPKRLWSKDRITLGELDDRHWQASRDHAEWDRHVKHLW